MQNYSYTILKLLSERHGIYRDIIVTAAILKSMPLKSHALLEAQPQSLLVNMFDASGLSCTLIPSIALLSKHGFELAKLYKKLGIESTFIGKKSRDHRLVSKVQAGYAGLAEQTQLIRERTYTEVCGMYKNLSWVALSVIDEALFLDNSKIITEQRPLISGRCKKVTESMQDWGDKNGYIFLNSFLSAPTANDEEQVVYAFPSLSWAMAAQSYSGTQLLVSNKATTTDRLIREYYSPLLSINSAIGRLTLDYLKFCRRWYSMDKLMAFNFYPVETDGEHYWRWQGPSPSSRLFIPLMAQGHYKISLQVGFLPQGVSSKKIKCFFDGTLTFFDVIHAGQSISFEYYVPTNGNTFELLITSNEMTKVDGKELGFSLNGLTVEWVEGQIDE